MSLDFYLEKKKWEEVTEEVYWENYTHNVVEMWNDAGCYDALYMSNGMNAKDIIPFLDKAIKSMSENPDDYKKLNPENGWGDYDSALEFLKRVRGMCDANPDAVIRISK